MVIGCDPYDRSLGGPGQWTPLAVLYRAVGVRGEDPHQSDARTRDPDDRTSGVSPITPPEIVPGLSHSRLLGIDFAGKRPASPLVSRSDRDLAVRRLDLVVARLPEEAGRDA